MNGFSPSDFDSFIGGAAKGLDKVLGTNAKEVVVVGGAEAGPPNKTELVAGGLPKLKVDLLSAFACCPSLIGLSSILHS